MIVYLRQECLIVSGIESKWSSVKIENWSFQISNHSDHLVQTNKSKSMKYHIYYLSSLTHFSPRHVPPTIASTSIDRLCYYYFRLQLIHHTNMASNSTPLEAMLPLFRTQVISEDNHCKSRKHPHTLSANSPQSDNGLNSFYFVSILNYQSQRPNHYSLFTLFLIDSNQGRMEPVATLTSSELRL